MKKLFLFFAFLLALIFLSYAHPGGHYHPSDIPSLRKWELKMGGNIIQGNFKSLENKKVHIEGMNGQEWIIPIEQLSKTDRQYVIQVASKVKQLNEVATLTGVVGPIDGAEDSINHTWLLAVISLFLAWVLLLRVGDYSGKHRGGRPVKLFMISTAVLLLFLSVFACKKSIDNGNGNGDSDIISANQTAFMDSAFAPFKPFITTGWDTRYFYVGSNGIPQHGMMVGISSWQQQVPIPQYYTGANRWSVPLQPVFADTPLSTRTNLLKGAVAIAVNGIPIFNALNNRGADAFLTGELDNWGGHCGRGDDYHYHAAPIHLSGPSASLPIAYALDGFAVYGSKEPDGSAMQPLDTCHGHKLSGQNYHYHGTANYPYVIGAMRGKVSLDPATPAPENQIIPQAFADPVRPATSPLRGAVITDFKSLATDHYLLTYKIGSKTGYVEYSWDAAGKYTYILTDTMGVTVTNQYQR